MGKRSRRLKRQEHNIEYLEGINPIQRFTWTPVKLVTLQPLRVAVQYDPNNLQGLTELLLSRQRIILHYDKLISIMSPGIRVFIQQGDIEFDGYLQDFRPGLSKQDEPEMMMTIVPEVTNERPQESVS